MSHVIIVAGARPNFMKVAPVLKALARNRLFEAQLIHTGQHYDEQMSDVFFRQLGISPPHTNLEVRAVHHGAQTGRVIESFEEFLLRSNPRPAGVIVVGDVNSTLACSIAAVKLGIPVAHLEAGLRSFDRSMPEEINRVLTDAISDILLVSDPEGELNLLREGVPPERIRFVGNVMIDSLVEQLAEARALDMPGTLGLSRGEYALVTLHRPNNVDVPAMLERLTSFLLRVAKNTTIVFPLHPRTRDRLIGAGLLEQLEDTPQVRLLGPVGYRENVGLMEGARFVLTDSGGIQEETSYLGVPCLTLRPNTERPATVTEGTNTIIGDDLSRAESLIDEIQRGQYKQGRPIAGWDGRAAERVITAIAEKWPTVALPDR